MLRMAEEFRTDLGMRICQKVQVEEPVHEATDAHRDAQYALGAPRGQRPMRNDAGLHRVREV